MAGTRDDPSSPSLNQDVQDDTIPDSGHIDAPGASQSAHTEEPERGIYEQDEDNRSIISSSSHNDDDDDDTPTTLSEDETDLATAAELSRIYRSRSYSFAEEEENNTINPKDNLNNANNDDGTASKDGPVSWMSLPNKSQLLVLTLARFSEPLTQSSLQAYIFHQIKSFDPNLPDSTISEQTGVIQGAFSAAQFFTAVVWGWLADSEFMGRKRVLLVGLIGTCVSSVGFGLSHSFQMALFWRTVGGALNSNAGVMRAMISELVPDKKYVRTISPFSQISVRIMELQLTSEQTSISSVFAPTNVLQYWYHCRPYRRWSTSRSHPKLSRDLWPWIFARW